MRDKKNLQHSNQVLLSFLPHYIAPNTKTMQTSAEVDCVRVNGELDPDEDTGAVKQKTFINSHGEKELKGRKTGTKSTSARDQHR